MKHKFLLGAVAGASALVVAVPLLSQFSSAAPTASVSSDAASVATQPSSENTQEKADKEAPDGHDATIDPSQAKISLDVAKQAALQAQAGKVIEEKLENEDGPLVYSIQIVDQSQKYHDVKVDATAGKVLKVEADEPDNLQDKQGANDSRDANEQSGGAEVKDAKDQNETNDANGQDDQNEQEGTQNSAGTPMP